MASGKFRVRNFTTSDKRVRRLESAWREVIDTERYRLSTRQELIHTMEAFQTTLTDQPHSRGKILEKIRRVESQFDAAQGNVFSDIHERLDDYLDIDESQRRSDADELKEDLKHAIEYSETDIEAIFDDRNVEKSTDDFYGEIIGKIAEFAKRESTVEPDIEELQGALTDAIGELTAPEFRTEYKSEFIDDIASFLHYEDNFPKKRLSDIVADLSAELRTDGWTFEKSEAVDQSKTDIDRLLNEFTTDDFESHDKRIDHLIDSVSGINHGREYYVPLPDCNLDVDRLFVGKITIYDTSHDDFDLRSRLQVDDGSLEEDSSEYGLSKSIINDDLESTDKFAYLATTGPVRGVSRKKMREELFQALDALNFYRDRGLVLSPFQQSSYILYEIEPDGTGNRYISWNQQRGHQSNLSTDQIRDHIERHEPFFDISDNASELEQGYKDSLRWFRYGLESYQPEDQFLKFVISLENVLVPNRTERQKKQQLAERAMRLLQIMPKFEDEYRPIFQQMYDVRSQIVHDAARNLPELERNVKRLQSRTRLILSVVREHLDSCDTIAEVVDEIESKEDALWQDRKDRAPHEIGDTEGAVGILTDSNGLYYGNVAVQVSLQDDGRYLYYDGTVTGLRNPPDDAIFELIHDPMLELYIDGELYRTENLRFLNDGLIREVLQASEDTPIPALWNDIIPIEELSLQDDIQATPFATILPTKLRMYSDGTKAQFIFDEEDGFTDEFPHSVKHSFNPGQEGAYELFHIDAADRDEYQEIVEEYGEFQAEISWTFSNTLVTVSEYFEVCQFAKAVANDTLETIQLIAQGRSVGEIEPHSQIPVPAVDWKHWDCYRKLAQLERRIGDDFRTLGFFIDEQIETIESASNPASLYSKLEKTKRPIISWVNVEAETADGHIAKQWKLGPIFNPLHLPIKEFSEQDEELVSEWEETRHKPFVQEVSTTMALSEVIERLREFSEEWENDINKIGTTLHLPPKLELVDEPKGLHTRLKIRFEPVKANLLYLEQEVSYTVTELEDE